MTPQIRSKFQAKANSLGRKGHVNRLQEAAELVIKTESDNGDDDDDLLDDPAPIGRFLNIPWDIRLSIYKLCLPCNKNLVLDPHHMSSHAPRYRCYYKNTTSLLRISRQVHSEVLPLVYSINTLTIVRPIQMPKLEQVLSEAGLQQVRDIEVCVVSRLAELGRLFQSWHVATPLARSLRLSFYKSKPDDALTCLGDLAWRAWAHHQYIVKVELHESWHSFYGKSVTDRKINDAINMASFQARVYDLRLPVQLKVITISFPVEKKAHGVFISYRGQVPNGDGSKIDWRFNKDGNKDKKRCKYLIWGDGKPK